MQIVKVTCNTYSRRTYANVRHVRKCIDSWISIGWMDINLLAPNQAPDSNSSSKAGKTEMFLRSPFAPKMQRARRERRKAESFITSRALLKSGASRTNERKHRRACRQPTTHRRNATYDPDESYLNARRPTTAQSSHTTSLNTFQASLKRRDLLRLPKTGRYTGCTSFKK